MLKRALPLLKLFTLWGLEAAPCNGHITTDTNLVITTPASKPFKDVPGPRALPFVGQLYHFLPGGEVCSFVIISWLHGSHADFSLKFYQGFTNAEG
ncbi:hypothetical protein RR46_14654 [Papilio xuthus]|uniref:Uncharacterized protein n=1 Tax=Papilio xuthus TaxID=66420 RepID=A0A194PJ88_PAPXU|nr:hypothetical protein RR46_14654 [Papilio xuthus]